MRLSASTLSLAGVTSVTAGGLDSRGLPRELTDPKSVLSQRSIYFDLDKYEVKDEYKDLVAAHAKYLVANKGFKVLIQGNTDERGSREYNLSLGQKRSDAVKRSLVLLGAKEEQALPLMYRMAGSGWICVAANYRLSPSVGFPTHLQDCKAALRWLKRHAAELGADPARTAAWGASAAPRL